MPVMVNRPFNLPHDLKTIYNPNPHCVLFFQGLVTQGIITEGMRLKLGPFEDGSFRLVNIQDPTTRLDHLNKTKMFLVCSSTA